MTSFNNMTVNANEAFVTLDEAVTAIMVYGKTIAPILVSEPGVGKSSTLQEIARRNGDKWRKPQDYETYRHTDKNVYIKADMSQKDFQDFFVYGPDRATMKLQIFMADLLKSDDPRPHVIFLDEITKRTSKIMEAATSGMLLEHRFGEWIAPEGSIVYGAANNASDGVGDTMLAHNGNRSMILNLLKSNNRSWATWALNNGIDASLASWALATPEAFQSYKTCPESELKNNHMIFIPNKNALTFASLRSIAACDVIVKNMGVCGENLTRAALHGTVGAAAAESMLTHFALGKDLPEFADIVANPEGTTVPTKFASQLMCITKRILANVTTQDELTACITYVNRMDRKESHAFFHGLLAKLDRTKKLANGNAAHNKWMLDNKNYELIG